MSAGRPPKAPHPPSPPQPRQCQAKNKDGRPCKARPLKDSDFCRIHDPRPAVKAAVKASNSKGGRRATIVGEWMRIEIKDSDSLRTFLNEVLNQVAGGKMPAKTSYALAPHLAHMVKLLEAQGCNDDNGKQAFDPAELLGPVLQVLDAAPDAKAELIKRLEMLGK